MLLLSNPWSGGTTRSRNLGVKAKDATAANSHWSPSSPASTANLWESLGLSLMKRGLWHISWNRIGCIKWPCERSITGIIGRIVAGNKIIVYCRWNAFVLKELLCARNRFVSVETSKTIPPYNHFTARLILFGKGEHVLRHKSSYGTYEINSIIRLDKNRFSWRNVCVDAGRGRKEETGELEKCKYFRN